MTGKLSTSPVEILNLEKQPPRLSFQIQTSRCAGRGISLRTLWKASRGWCCAGPHMLSPCLFPSHFTSLCEEHPPSGTA